MPDIFLHTRKGSKTNLNLLGHLWKVAVTAAVSLAALVFFSVSACVLWCIFLLFLLYDWGKRLPFVIAILCLIECPILILINTADATTWAQQIAIYAYYFLLMTVVLQMIEFKRKGKHD